MQRAVQMQWLYLSSIEFKTWNEHAEVAEMVLVPKYGMSGGGGGGGLRLVSNEEKDSLTSECLECLWYRPWNDRLWYPGTTYYHAIALWYPQQQQLIRSMCFGKLMNHLPAPVSLVSG